MAPAQASVCHLETVDTGLGAVYRTAETGCGQGPRCENGGQRSRPVAAREQPRPRHRAAQCLLRLARASTIDGHSIAQPAEPPYTDPYVRWCDRESWRQPTYVDFCLRRENQRGTRCFHPRHASRSFNLALIAIPGSDNDQRLCRPAVRKGLLPFLRGHPARVSADLTSAPSSAVAQLPPWRSGPRSVRKAAALLPHSEAGHAGKCTSSSGGVKTLPFRRW